jgi:hypothetical protein
MEKDMLRSHAVRSAVIAAMVAAGVWFDSGRAVAAPPVPESGQDGLEVLTRGPVHEAFAETVTFDPEPGIITPRAPPAAIDEVAPDLKPEGANVDWIPGYWAWDDDTSDFVWVSGVWRALPPGRQWIAGYWARAGKGAQWTSGYWADASLTEIEYLPEPPETAEAGPTTEAPSPDSTWLPGGWVWQKTRYVWQPGFWSPGQTNWDWTPAHYQWSPRGYVYVDGYWDYAVNRRGVLFAPVSIDQRRASQQGFSYTPSAVIDLAVFANHLFLRPNYGHYYYGDYYAKNYATAGFYPSYAYNSGRHGYDPIYARNRWTHRQDKDWERRAESDYQNRRDHEDSRPPRTFAAQQELSRKGLTDDNRGRVFAQPLDQFTKAKNGPMRFQPVNDDDRKRYGQLSRDVRSHGEARQKLENRAVDPVADRPSRTFGPGRAPLPKSPFVARGADKFEKDQGPPKAHVLPQTDPKIVPKPRPAVGQGRAREPRPDSPVAGAKPNPGATTAPPPKRDVKPGPGANQGQPLKPEPKQTQPVPRANPTPPKAAPQPNPPKGNPQEKPQGGLNPPNQPK